MTSPKLLAYGCVVALACACTGGPAKTGSTLPPASASAGASAGPVASGDASASAGGSHPAGSTVAPIVAGAKNLGPLTVASAGFTESYVMAALYSALLTRAGYTVTVSPVLDGQTLESSLESGLVDVVPEYAASYADQLNTVVRGANAASVASPDLARTMAALTPLAAYKGVTPLTPTNAVDEKAFAVTVNFARRYGLKTLSDLGKSGVPVKLAADATCATESWCQPGLLATYGIKVTATDNLGIDTSIAKKEVMNGHDQLAVVLTTDATLAADKLVILTDDKGLQDADNVLPLVNTKFLGAHPDIAATLNALVAVLTTTDLAGLDQLVDTGQDSPADAASGYLKAKGLI